MHPKPELKEKQQQEYFEAIANLTNRAEAEAFLGDVATLAELKAMSERWQVAKLVDKGVSYREINKQTGVSTATITRVAKWLKYGMGGYRMMIDRRKGKRIINNL